MEGELVGYPDAGIQELPVGLAQDRKIPEGQPQQSREMPRSNVSYVTSPKRTR
jgi:hypothetical protein